MTGVASLATFGTPTKPRGEAMAAEDQLLILTAKTVMLERLVRLLLLDRIRDREDPIGIAKQLGAEMVRATEAEMAGGPYSAAAMLAVENLQAFFDALIHEVSVEQRPRR